MTDIKDETIKLEGHDKIRNLSSLFDNLRWIPESFSDYQKWVLETDSTTLDVASLHVLPASYPGKRRYTITAYGSSILFIVKRNPNGGYHVLQSSVFDHTVSGS